MRDEAVYSRTDIHVVFGAAFEDLPGSPQVLEKIVPAGFPGIGVEIQERRMDVSCGQWEWAASAGCAILCQRTHKVRKIAHAPKWCPRITAEKAANESVGATDICLHRGERSTGPDYGHTLLLAAPLRSLVKECVAPPLLQKSLWLDEAALTWRQGRFRLAFAIW
jgi:hypothetical protein